LFVDYIWAELTAKFLPDILESKLVSVSVAYKKTPTFKVI